MRPMVRPAVAVAAALLCSTAVVRAADQEVIPSTEAADSATIVSTIEGGVNAAYALGVRPALRDAHAKAHGCVRATFTVDDDLPQNLRVGLFAAPTSYKAWIRFSNGSGTPHDDASGDGRGMAVKVIGVPGDKLLKDVPEAEKSTQDFVMINYPAFFIRNVADYVPFTALSLKGKSAEFYATHQHEAEVVKAITSMTVGEVFDQRYFSMTPYLLGDQYTKFSARPVDCASGAALTPSDAPVPADDPDFLRARMAKWLGGRDACFRLGIQVQTDPATQPVEDPTIIWDETTAPFVDVASIRIPAQAFESKAQDTFCDNLSYTPWHALPEERPVGGINRLRKEVYAAISALRHRLNKAASVEPTGDETFE
ncbi:MAG: catalase family protein [Rhizobiales bacterium]|nr:catalase family protein [Hyphomicrobiales bacterium]